MHYLLKTSCIESIIIRQLISFITSIFDQSDYSIEINSPKWIQVNLSIIPPHQKSTTLRRNSFDVKKMDLFRYLQFCSHCLLILITLVKDVHTTKKICSGFRRNPAFDNLALNTSTFRIQVRNEIKHPMCAHSAVFSAWKRLCGSFSE